MYFLILKSCLDSLFFFEVATHSLEHSSEETGREIQQQSSVVQHNVYSSHCFFQHRLMLLVQLGMSPLVTQALELNAHIDNDKCHQRQQKSHTHLDRLTSFSIILVCIKTNCVTYI